MSVQFIVATPYGYYGHWLKIEKAHWFDFNPTKRAVLSFYAAVSGYPELYLPQTFDDRQFFCEDVQSKPSMELDKWLCKYHPELCEPYNADIYVPNRFAKRIQVRLPCYIKNETDYYFGSSYVLLETIGMISHHLEQQPNEAFSAQLEVLKEAAEVSIKEKQPIFSSY